MDRKDNPAQQEAIHFVSGAMLVLAGPGSGKTYVITRRIKYLIEEKGINPQNILVITFTKAAAIEMKQRSISVSPKAGQVIFGTFHSVFFQILRQSNTYHSFTLLTEREKRVLYKSVKDLQGQIPDYATFIKEMSYLKNKHGSRFWTYISENSQEENNETRNLKTAISLYMKECCLQQKLDFDDILLYCLEYLSSNIANRRIWQQRFKFCMIDEFQDTNQCQYEIVKLLCPKDSNIFAVGDDDQSIYGFRGSNPAFMRQFLEDYESARKICLKVNYRCPSGIVDASTVLIRNNKNRFDKDINSFIKDDDSVYIQGFSSEAVQQAFMIEKIKKCFEAKESCCILIRTNQSGMVYKMLLAKEKLPYIMKETATNIFEEYAAKDILAFLKFCSIEHKREHFFRFMNKQKNILLRSIIPPIIDFESLLSVYDISSETYQYILSLKKDTEFAAKLDPYAAIHYFIKKMKYEKHLDYEFREKENECNKQKEIVKMLMAIALKYESIPTFLEAVSNITDNDMEEKIVQNKCENTNDMEENNRINISIMTYHSSKGLEFSNVFIPDVNPGIVPHGRMLSENEMEEERRMFYVAMTRAKKSLYITYIKDIQAKESAVSEFIKNLEEFY